MIEDLLAHLCQFFGEPDDIDGQLYFDVDTILPKEDCCYDSEIRHELSYRLTRPKHDAARTVPWPPRAALDYARVGYFRYDISGCQTFHSAAKEYSDGLTLRDIVAWIVDEYCKEKKVKLFVAKQGET